MFTLRCYIHGRMMTLLFYICQQTYLTINLFVIQFLYCRMQLLIGKSLFSLVYICYFIAFWLDFTAVKSVRHVWIADSKASVNFFIFAEAEFTHFSLDAFVILEVSNLIDSAATKI